eukprot:811247_1
MASNFLLYLSITNVVFGDHWGYGDQTDWHLDHPECGKDRDESPINILDKNVIIDSKKCVPQFEWKINETHHKFEVENNGKTLQVTPINDDHTRVKHPIGIFPNYFHPTDR